MSGFLPDIANWALGGGAGGAGGGDGEAAADENEGSNNNNEETTTTSTPSTEPTPEEMRAKRMARLAALEKSSSTASSNADNKSNSGGDTASPMEVDKPSVSSTSPMDIDTEKPKSKPSPITTTKDATMEPAPKKKMKAPPSSPVDPNSKIRRKKTLLLRRVLLVTIGDSSYDRTPPCVHLTLDDDEIYNTTKSPTGVQVHHIAELLAARLALSPSSRSLETIPSQTKLGLVAYLGGCHKRAGEELKELKHGKNKKKSDDGSLDELIDILDEIRSQVVSYAASSLMVPDLFELGADAPLQLAKCLSTTSIDPTSSITFDVLGKNTSFYYSVCEELHSQDADSFGTVIADVVKHITDSLSKCKTLLDEGPTQGVTGNGIFLTSALRELCTSKKAAVAFARMPSFLLPAANTPRAAETCENPNLTPQQVQMAQMMQAFRRPGEPPVLPGSYKRRSGPALEDNTTLGLVLRLGFPFPQDPREQNNPLMQAFSDPMRRDIDQTTAGFRRQLELYQNKCNELIKQLVVAGEESRKQVIQWFTDALLLNTRADGMRADRSKVSSAELLTNLSAVLLKLCDPFIQDPKKASLVDPGFVCSPESHGGVYSLTVEDAIARLGVDVTDKGDYNPKNSFIPLCFFFCSRILALSVVPRTRRYDNILRNINHEYHDSRSRNDDPRSNPRFISLMKLQHIMEISLKSPTYIPDVFRYYNMAAGIFLQMDKELLKTIPEHIVYDMCAVLDYATDWTPKLMSGVDLGNIFRLTVTLLSKEYAPLVRNYNLRAKLGDVLHDVFLPDKSSRRQSEVPASVTCDPLAGGQPYLTSDKLAKESLAPSLLVLYGEVENTGFYEKNAHRTKIAALLKYLWDSPQHRPAFKKVTEDKSNFITFANGIMNETNSLFGDVMERLPEIRKVQLQMANPQEWGALSEEERETISERHEDNEKRVKTALSLCNSVMKMLGFLNTDSDIRNMFLLPDMCSRLANMLLFVLNKLVGSRGLDLKVDNPESYNFKPKEMLQDLCVIFSSFAAADEFQVACAKSGYYSPDLMNKSVKTCRKLGLLVGDSMELFALLATKVEDAAKALVADEGLYEDAPDEFLDPLTQEWMADPVLLPTSDTIVDRSTISQHLLNDSTDPFNRKELTIDEVVPASELKEKMKVWLDEKKKARDGA